MTTRTSKGAKQTDLKAGRSSVASAVGVREFRSNLPEYVKGKRIVEVQRHGKPIAVILPVYQPQTPQERQALLNSAAEAFEHIRVNLNLNEEELALLISGKGS